MHSINQSVFYYAKRQHNEEYAKNTKKLGLHKNQTKLNRQYKSQKYTGTDRLCTDKRKMTNIDRIFYKRFPHAVFNFMIYAEDEIPHSLVRPVTAGFLKLNKLH